MPLRLGLCYLGLQWPPPRPQRHHAEQAAGCRPVQLGCPGLSQHPDALRWSTGALDANVVAQRSLLAPLALPRSGAQPLGLADFAPHRGRPRCSTSFRRRRACRRGRSHRTRCSAPFEVNQSHMALGIISGSSDGPEWWGRARPLRARKSPGLDPSSIGVSNGEPTRKPDPGPRSRAFALTKAGGLQVGRRAQC